MCFVCGGKTTDATISQVATEINVAPVNGMPDIGNYDVLFAVQQKEIIYF
jgi:hypothetical protein